jgi:hypothetical protein
MSKRTRKGDGGETTLPREFLEHDPVEEGDLFEARHDASGNVVLRRVVRPEFREYIDEDMEMFTEEDRLSAALEERMDRVLAREPRLFRR